ncbi:branched-chain amino acid ABC transporter permease [candidate division TA06 bacterium]|uniref:Branched-chain amino acid ABC transporter permease n=1 Tax=candidate division TA06 bacterium TaxID=2250710 RepID=A0A933IF57_UNCT6|nr:branched-chain amino acid ABC transporter permease [candidate division TA06 bacterium]
MIKHLKILVWPLWIGLLCWPFMGPKGAWITAVALAAATLAFTHFGKALAPKISQVNFSPGWAVLNKFPQKAWLALGLTALAIFPFALNNYYLDVMITAGIYIVLALGLNIIVGLAGLLVLGYIAFYAVGAYAYAILGTQYHLSFFLALPLASLLALLFGFVLGLPTLRLRGDYLAIVTLGFGEIIRIVLNNWDGFTGGPNGIMHIPRPSLFGLKMGTPAHLYFLVLAMIALVSFLIGRLNDSRLGRALIAMREDETAARACGVDTTRLKMLAFALSAAVAGMMGVVFAAKMNFVSPESFTFWESVMILCMVVLGGMASIPGVILGALILVVIPEWLRPVQNFRMLIFGASMVAMMIFRPQGLLPSKRKTYKEIK